MLEYYYTIATTNGVDQFRETHELGLWTLEQYTKALLICGFDARLEQPGFTPTANTPPGGISPSMSAVAPSTSLLTAALQQSPPFQSPSSSPPSFSHMPFIAVTPPNPNHLDDHGMFVAKKTSTENDEMTVKQYCKVVCTGDWTAQLNYLIEKGWEIAHFAFETESKYRELDDYGKPLKHGIGWYDVHTQCILLEKTRE